MWLRSTQRNSNVQFLFLHFSKLFQVSLPCSRRYQLLLNLKCLKTMSINTNTKCSDTLVSEGVVPNGTTWDVGGGVRRHWRPCPWRQRVLEVELTESVGLLIVESRSAGEEGTNFLTKIFVENFTPRFIYLSLSSGHCEQGYYLFRKSTQTTHDDRLPTTPTLGEVGDWWAFLIHRLLPQTIKGTPRWDGSLSTPV